ncbi:MAG TPA: VWA domain-containing protein [Gemmatimonadaceae bacterium]|nr:VWA domain-containing protein [Gemmatimonadaceae bacterium]
MAMVVDYPWLAVAAPLGGVLGWYLVRRVESRRLERLHRFAEPRLLARLGVAPSDRDARWSSVRWGAVLFLVLLALAGPRWGSETLREESEGLDMVLALDVSTSMLATDEVPSRLERMKREVRRLIGLSSSGDRFALLAFAGRSYILTPLTSDRGALELFLDNLDPAVVGQQGTTMSLSIEQAVRLLDAAPSEAGRVIVVMSDGETFEETDAALEAARRAGRAGVGIVTVGFGTAEGSTIPVRVNGKVSAKVDDEGNVIVTRYRADVLRAVARAGGGTFVEAATTDKASAVQQAVAAVKRAGRTATVRAQLPPRFPWFLTPALLLLLLRKPGPRLRYATTAIAVASLAACSLPPVAQRQAADSYRRGDYRAALELYRDIVERGDRNPVAMYNLGTTMLALDSLEAAEQVLAGIAGEIEDDVRYRVWYNLGLAQLRRGLREQSDSDSGRAEQALEATLATYKRVLLLRPYDSDAKWNYELALRRRRQLEGSGGGGGGSAGGGGSGAGQQPNADDLQRMRAAELLNNAAREERQVQARRQRETRTTIPPRSRDW